MKSFIAASLLLVVVCGAICGNAVVLAGRLDKIEKFAEGLKRAEPSERLTEARRTKDAWEKERFLFCLSVQQIELEKMDDCLARLCAAAECKSDSDYFITVADLGEALAQLRNLVELSYEGIF